MPHQSSSSDTDIFIAHAQSKRNSLWLKIIAGLLSVLIAILAWLGSGVVAKVEASRDAIWGIQLSVTEIKGKVNTLEESMKNYALKSDVAILQQEQADTKKELDLLRRRVAPAGRTPPP